MGVSIDSMGSSGLGLMLEHELDDQNVGDRMVDGMNSD